MKAIQIVNLNNPVSVKYHKHSLKSFEAVKDVLEIEPFQCFTPDTLPTDHTYKEKNNRTLYEQACFASHFHLVKRLSKGESFIIMEHDAYLWPDRINIFYELMALMEKYSAFYLGISNEFYTLNESIAKIYVDKVVNKKITGGPMTTALQSINEYSKINTSLCLWPVVGQKKQICSSLNANNSSKGLGKIFDAPVTQHFMMEHGSTIIERANRWKFTPEKNPDMFFTYE